MTRDIQKEIERICNTLEEKNETLTDLSNQIKSWNNECRLTEAIRHISEAINQLNEIDMSEESFISQGL